MFVRLTSDIKDDAINIFELGIWAVPLFVTNLVLLGFAIAYYKKKLPLAITNAIKFILNFETSPRTSFIVILVLFTIFIGLSVGDLRHEETWQDYITAKDATLNWNVDNGDGFIFSFKYFLLYSSLVIFKNIRIIPFISSIFLLILTYFFTAEITKKRFAGIVSLIIVLQSNNFLTYSSSATYSNFWILLYLLSLYLMLKKWYLSPIAYIWSVFSKGLTIVFLPMMLFFIYSSKIAKRKKILLTIPYGIFSIFVLIDSNISYLPQFVPPVSFYYHNFWNGFTSLPSQLRSDGLVLVFLLPLIVGLFIASKQGKLYANSIMILIMGVLLSFPLLAGLVQYTLEPYREIPLIVFFAIGSGLIFSKKLSSGPDNRP
ncbi:MAG: hypothetical protein HY222_07885 [Thaumarchaeota archaeon]|nr:hypothetical protein [Nitrososphaerota archaeon]MBI3642295.1 hypothetical protein [Nitrososphaerota archaeon]